MELDRNALLVYLSNLRMLETVIHESDQKNIELNQKLIEIDEEKKKYDSNLTLRQPSPPPPLEKIRDAGRLGCFGIGLLVLIVTAIALGIYGLVKWSDSFFLAVLLIACGIFLLIPVVRFKMSNIEEINNYPARLIRYNEQKRKIEEDRVLFFSSLDEKIDNISQMQNTIRTEKEQFKVILEDAYSLNIIPLPFRNIQGVYYLYDYISTSSETLTSAFMQANLESIKQKIDDIIKLQGAMLIQQVQANKMIFEQNNQMLSSLRNVEQYSRIAAINSQLSVRLQSEQLAYQAADYILNNT